MTLRVGVIGAGFGARVVAPVFAATDGCLVVDVVSARDDDAVRELCGRRDLDLVTVHSPPFLHRPHVELALEGGHAVLCDKPFGRTAGEAGEMLTAAASVGVVHLVNFEFRHQPARLRLRELVADGSLGAVGHIVWTCLSAGSRSPMRPHGWLFDRAAGGGWVGAWGSHAVDALRWLFGDVALARAVLRTDVGERPDRAGALRACDAEDGFTAWLELEAGTSVSIDTSFAAPVSLAQRLLFVGSEGVAECVNDGRVVFRCVDGTRTEWECRVADGDPHLVAMRAWAEVVRDAVIAGVAPPGAPTFADGLACREVLDALLGGAPRPV
ncbi:MAG: Gfo/Idh/MocA family oxidoreductase [Actinobacteria bacterium]|nr:Gfo/Idh/MocA family oxidoreductase [Actinomycetota bacterium]